MVARGRGRGGVGGWGQQMQSPAERMDTEQGPLCSTGSYIQCPVLNHKGKEHEKECARATESLCYTADINRTLQ